jgi:hypothetical protein
LTTNGKLKGTRARFEKLKGTRAKIEKLKGASAKKNPAPENECASFCPAARQRSCGLP